jgi:hypothetical protein
VELSRSRAHPGPAIWNPLASPGFRAGSLGFSWIGGFAFPWFSLDSLVRIVTFQRVTDVRRLEISFAVLPVPICQISRPLAVFDGREVAIRSAHETDCSRYSDFQQEIAREPCRKGGACLTPYFWRWEACWRGGRGAAGRGFEGLSGCFAWFCFVSPLFWAHVSRGLPQASRMRTSARFMFIAVATHWRWQLLRARPR